MKIGESVFTKGVALVAAMVVVLFASSLAWGAEEEEKTPSQPVTPITNEYRVAPMDPAQKIGMALVYVGEFKDSRPDAEIKGEGSGFMTQESSEVMSKDTLVGALRNVMKNELTSTAGIKSDTAGVRKPDYVLTGNVTHFIVTKKRELVNLLPYVSNVTNLFVGEPIYHTAEIQITLINKATGKVAYDSSYTAYFETKQTPGPVGIRNFTPYQTVEREVHVLMDRMVTSMVLDLHSVLEKQGEAFSLSRAPIREAEDYYWEELDKKQMKGDEGWAGSAD